MHTIVSEHFVDADGFGVCFEMGKKCYSMSPLYIPSLCVRRIVTEERSYFLKMGQTRPLFVYFSSFLTSHGQNMHKFDYKR